MSTRQSFIDPRYFQIFFQLIFLGYGMLVLGWEQDWLKDAINVIGCLLISYAAESLRQKKWQSFGKFQVWGTSACISALGICLLLRTHHWYTNLLAVLLTVSSKYFIRLNGRHIFNPSAIGIAGTVWLSGDAWLSPGQWGTDAILILAVITFGSIIVTKVQKLDLSLSFLFTYAGLLYVRHILQLGWPADYLVHSLASGSLLLFTFFMISDPKTSPSHWAARIIWAAVIAGVAFYLSAYRWVSNPTLWALVAAGPLVPVLNRLFKSTVFHWQPVDLRINLIKS